MKVKVLNTQTQVEIREMNLSDSIDRSGECLLGRSPHSGLVLDSPDVSRLHAKFSIEDGQYYFYDLGSANGSLVNGKIIQSNQAYLLKSGDIIRLGEFVLILQAIGEQPEELAATVVGDPNATVIGLQPDMDWFSNKESESALSATGEQQENQLFEAEKMALVEDLAAQEEEQEETEDLLVETDSSEAENSLAKMEDLVEMEEHSSQLEAIEGSELSEPEAIEDLELEKLEQELVEVEQQAEVFEQEAESGEAIESLWTENSSTEIIDEPGSPESIEILSRTEADSDLEINEIQSDKQNLESDLAESIGLIPDPIPDQRSDQQTPEAEAEGSESDSFSEPTLIQLDESENIPPQPSERVDSESNSTEIDTVESQDLQILEESRDLKFLESAAFDSESTQVEASDISISESDESVESEAPDLVAESASASESTFIQPDDQTESEPFNALDLESEFASEPTLPRTDIQSDQQPDQQINQLDEPIETVDFTAESSPEVIPTRTDEMIDEETVEAIDESAHSSDGTMVQSLEPVETEPAEAIEHPEAEAIEEFEMPEDDQIASLSEASIEPVVEDIRSIDETENLDEVTGLSVADEITGLSAEEIEALDPAATLEQTTTESVEVMPLETMEPVEPVAAEADPVKTDVAAALESQIPELTEASATYPDKYIALLAHDSQKLELIDFVAHHKDLLLRCLTIATPGVNDLLKRDLGFEVSQQTPAIPPDGYQTINSLITSDKILAVIFLRDFFTPQTTQANDEAFSRSCNIRQVMFASNLPTAEAIVHAIRANVITP